MPNPYRLFRLRFVTDPEGGGSDPKPGSEELGFPADTDPADMTPEEQLAYWKNDAEKWKSLSKKHEKNRKPKDFDQLVADAQAFREKQDEDLKPDEKAAKDAAKQAREEGRTEGISALLERTVRAEFKARAPHLSDDELDELIEDIDVTPARFYPDGELDVDRIERFAKKLAPAPSNDDEDDDKTPRFNLGHVLAGGGARKKGESHGVAYYRQQEAERYKTNK